MGLFVGPFQKSFLECVSFYSEMFGVTYFEIGIGICNVHGGT